MLVFVKRIFGTLLWLLGLDFPQVWLNFGFHWSLRMTGALNQLLSRNLGSLGRMECSGSRSCIPPRQNLGFYRKNPGKSAKSSSCLLLDLGFGSCDYELSCGWGSLGTGLIPFQASFCFLKRSCWSLWFPWVVRGLHRCRCQGLPRLLSWHFCLSQLDRCSISKHKLLSWRGICLEGSFCFLSDWIFQKGHRCICCCSTNPSV